MIFKNMINIIADDREPEMMMNPLLDNEKVKLIKQRLSVGDYEIDGRLLVERKTLQDLVGSIKDGRLFDQACRLANSPLQTLIILEGTTKNMQAKMRREAIQGALITVSVYFGIPLLRSMSPEETIQLMLYTAQQGRARVQGGLPRKGKRPQGKRKIQLHILQGLPNIGAERASALLAEFGSVEAVLTATSDELQRIDGIGAGTAKQIRWAVQETMPIYSLS
jgi:ERCC4-type nuclease